jgi:hypothetical protein
MEPPGDLIDLQRCDGLDFLLAVLNEYPALVIKIRVPSHADRGGKN